MLEGHYSVQKTPFVTPRLLQGHSAGTLHSRSCNLAKLWPWSGVRRAYFVTYASLLAVIPRYELELVWECKMYVSFAKRDENLLLVGAEAGEVN